MTLESNKNLDEILIDGEDTRVIYFLGKWLLNEINRSINMAKDGGEVAMEGQKVLSTYTELITGTYLSRWSDPQTHLVLLSKLSENTFQRIIFGRLNTLCLVRELSRENFEVLFKRLLSLHTTPRIVDEKDNLQPGPVAIFQATTPDEDRLKLFFLENHWMLLLFLALASFTLLGYERVFYI